jgi:hypothetical protein
MDHRSILAPIRECSQARLQPDKAAWIDQREEPFNQAGSGHPAAPLRRIGHIDGTLPKRPADTACLRRDDAVEPRRQTRRVGAHERGGLASSSRKPGGTFSFSQILGPALCPRAQSKTDDHYAPTDDRTPNAPTLQITAPAPLAPDLKPRRNRGVRCICFVGRFNGHVCLFVPGSRPRGARTKKAAATSAGTSHERTAMRV